MPDLLTPAWRLLGLTGSESGVLTLDEGRLSFRTDDGVTFDVPLADVADVTVPWFYFGGGLKLTAGGEPYRFSFVRPNAAPPVSDHLLPEGTSGWAWIVAGRKAGAAWKEALGG